MEGRTPRSETVLPQADKRCHEGEKSTGCVLDRDMVNAVKQRSRVEPCYDFAKPARPSLGRVNRSSAGTQERLFYWGLRISCGLAEAVYISRFGGKRQGTEPTIQTKLLSLPFTLMNVPRLEGKKLQRSAWSLCFSCSFRRGH